MIEIESINRRIDEMIEDLRVTRPKPMSILTREEWDYGEDRTLYPNYLLLAEEFDNYARSVGIKVSKN